jgi:hypothetical protein
VLCVEILQVVGLLGPELILQEGADGREHRAAEPLF